MQRVSGTAIRTWHVLPVTALLSLLLVAPMLAANGALEGDAPVHIRWQAHFAAAFWQGHPFPRWLMTINDGFGSPAYFFYPPLLQWASALFVPLLPGAPNAMARLAMGLWLVSAGGALGCWFWLRALPLHRAAAFSGALLFLLMPYRCFVDVYQRGALPEAAGIAVMPWLLFGAVRLRRGGAAAWGGYALAVGAIFYSHLPSALIGVLLATGYLVALSGGRDLALLGRGATATLAGAAIGAWVIVPALALLGELTDTTAMFGPRNQPVNWLLFARPWIDPSMQLTTLALLGLTIVLGGLAAVVGWRQPDGGLRVHVAYLAGVIVAVLVLNSAISRPFWLLNTPLSRIQFPFRLLSADVLALSGLLAVAQHAVFAAPEKRRWLTTAAWALLPGFLLFDAGLLAFQAWQDRGAPPRPVAEILAELADTSEYVLGDLPSVRRQFGAAPAIAIEGDARASVLSRGGSSMALRTQGTVASRLALRQFQFTGWQCRVDGAEWVAAESLAAPRNLPVCRVPAGVHRLDARLPAPLPARVGAMLTALGLLVALVAIVWGSTRRGMPPHGAFRPDRA